MMKNIILLFPLWALIGSIGAYYSTYDIVKYEIWIVPLLVVIMFCMGVTLTFNDFKQALLKPKIIFTTVMLQFFVMPLSAYIISRILGFSLDLTLGMILVGAVSGGTASNVIAYIAKADVALSITMTAVSTLLSVVLTPYITYFYVGHDVSVPAMSILFGIAKVVLAPVLIGVVINYMFHQYIKKFYDFFALVSIMAIIFIIVIIVGLNQEKIFATSIIVIIGVVSHNCIGLVSGYYLAKILGYDKQTCRTVSIEVGMQNSALAIAIAMKYFGALPSLPGAIFSIWHTISGFFLATYWSKKDKI